MDWQAQAEAVGAEMDRLRAELAAALAGREPAWTQWDGHWSRTDYSAPGEKHTVRKLVVVRGKDGVVIDASKWNGHSQPTDVAEFTTVAEALAWIDTPRDPDPIYLRRAMAELERWAARNRVDLAGLAGERVNSGRNGKGEHYDVVEFDGVGRVRITTLGGGRWRVAHQRRTRVVAADGAEAARRAVRAAVEELADAAGRQR